MVRNHKWYMEPRLVTVNDLYAFDPNAKVSLEPFTDIIGRHFKQPKEGLGNDNSPSAHMWRTIANPMRRSRDLRLGAWGLGILLAATPASVRQNPPITKVSRSRSAASNARHRRSARLPAGQQHRARPHQARRGIRHRQSVVQG